MSIARVTLTTTSHAIPLHPHLQQASGLFHSLGNSYQERQANDAGIQMGNMAASMEILGIYVPFVARRPPPFQSWQVGLQEAVGGIISGAAITELGVAHSVLTQHRINTEVMAAASELMRTRLAELTSVLTPSWKQYLKPSDNWQFLINSCGDFLGNTDSDVIMAITEQAEQAI